MSAPVEAILAEIGKAFRLCRFYPATHPSVQQALAAVSAVLPDLAKVGVVELKISATGFAIGSAAVAPRNPPVQELAGLLYAQGHRFLLMEPGLAVDEVATLIRTASSGTERAMRAVGGQPAFEQLPHIRLAQSARKRTVDPQAKRPSGNAADAPVFGRRSMQVFRPDALPPDIETRRLSTVLEGDSAERPAAAERIGALVPELNGNRDFKSLAIGVRALGRAARGEDAATAAAAARALEAVPDAAIAGLVSRLGDATQAPAERDEAVQAVSALGARAIGPIADAFLTTSDTDERDILLAVVRRAGGAGVEPILARANPASRGEAARAQALLLGATGSPAATLLLVVFAMHVDATVREVAVAGLARIDDPEAVRITMAGLRDPDPRVRTAAAHGIGLFGDASAGPILLVRLEEEDDDTAAAALIGALGELRDARAVPVLSETARGVSGVFRRHAAEVRIAALRALGVIGTDEARELLIDALGAKSADVRAAAARALGR